MSNLIHSIDANSNALIDKIKGVKEEIDSYFNAIDSILVVLVALLYFIQLVKKKALNPFNAATYTSLINVVKHSSEKDLKIKEILDKLRIAVDADRLVIGMFHNTGSYSFNYHLLKMSVYHESRREGVDSIKKTIKDIPLSYLQQELNILNDSNNRFIRHLIENNLHNDCRSHLNSIGVESIANILLLSRKVPIAILSFQFKDDVSYKYPTIQFIEQIVKKRTSKDLQYFIDTLVAILTK